MATPTPPQSILREFCPLYYLLNSIPEKVQKGFRSVLVYLTALDSSRDFIAVGSSIGVLYLYSRRLSHMDKHHIKGKSEAITAVKLLSCFDDLVAVGTASGRVTVFQLVSQLPGRNKQLRRFDVLGLHKSTVTCLAWSTNGAKLFSGDDKGRVVFTALELDKGECKPVIFLEEASGIVQLEYSHTVLLVCSQQRALFFSTQQQVLQQMGTKPRKSGRFGACFLPALCKQSDLQVLAARPGFRLWRADIQGLAEDAQLFKDLSSTPVPEFQLFPRPSTAGAYHPAERQLGLLSCFHRDGWLLSWNEYSVYVVDCLNEVVIGALESCGDIVAVSSCQNEVFILKGDRDIIRVSSCPEGQTPSSDSSAGLASPLTTPTVLSPPIGSVETAQPIRTMAIVMEKQDAGGGARSAGEEEEEEEEEEPEEEEEVEPEVVEGSAPHRVGSRRDLQLLFLLPVGEHSPQRGSTHSRSSSVTSWDSGSTSLTPDLSELGSKRYSASLDPEELQQELVVKAIRVKKRMRRGRKDSCSRRTVSDGGWSEPMAGVQDGAGSHGNPQTQQPLLEHRPPEPEPSRAQDLQTTSGSEAGPLSLPPLLLEDPPDPAVPPTPDVDLLLECSFSYLQASQDPPPGPDLLPNGEDDEEFLSPLIGPEEEEEEEDAAPPCGREDPLFHSTVSTLDPEASDEEEDIYRCSGAPPGGEPGYCRPGGPPGGPAEEDQRSPKGDQLAECWMGYPGPGCGILSLHVTDRYVWCLDFKGVLFCSPLPDGGLKWQRFEDNIHQVAVSPSGGLLWKVEQKTMTAYACGKVSIKGKRHWYKALDLTASVALSNNAAWILRTNGDLYLQTGLSAERPCARSVKVETPCSFSQVCARGGVVWALSEEGAVFYREGLSSYCCEGDSWRNDKIRNVWAVDTQGMVYFRVGTQPLNPSMMLPAWICIEPPVQPVGVQLVSIHSSPNDRQLWALDNRGSVHVRTGLNEEMPVGTDWEQVPGLAASQLVLSVRTVWVRCPNGEIARRYGNTARNPAGDYWKRIPGMSHWLAVTPDDALWAVTVSGGLSHRLTKPLPHNPPADPAPPADDLEDEWEVI
ncbi:unnamed protein product [Gadus morhua 'NCC']